MITFESGNISDCFICGEKSTHYIIKRSFLKIKKRYFCKKCWLIENRLSELNKNKKK